MKQRAFHFCNFPRYIVNEIDALIRDDWRVVSMSSISNASNIHMMEVIVIAEKAD